MLKAKIGFLPSNWESWDGNKWTGKWAGKMKDRCVAVLKEIPGIELVVPTNEMTVDGCVSDIPEAEKVLEYFLKEKIKGLIIGNMTFGMEVAVGAFLSGLPKDMPIIHFATKSGPIAEDGSRSTDTWCGSFMTASAIKRRGFNFIHINTCNPEDKYFKDKLETFSRAINAISRFKGAKFGQLGTRPTLFESQNYSEQALQKKFGQMIIPIDLDTVFSKIDAVSPDNPLVKKTIDEITNGVEMVDYTEESLTNIARYEIALTNIAKESGVEGLAVSCWSRLQERFHIAACSTYGRLNDKGLITACEVDVLGAATMFALYNAALGEVIPDFIDWTDLHPTEENVWLAWHCGNAASSLCASDCKRKFMSNERLKLWCSTCDGTLEFRLKPGPVTCARLVEYDGEFTMFFGNGEIIDIPPFVRGTYGWVKVNDVFDWENKMVESGIVHHGVLIHDPKVADALEMFCNFLGIKSVRGK